MSRADSLPGKMKIFLLFLVVQVSGSFSYAQFSWKLNGEMGLFNSSATGFSENRDFLSRLDAQLKYNYTNNNRQAALNLRIRPEIYDFDNQRSTLKVKAAGSYIQDDDNISWGFNLSTQRQNFRDDSFNSYYESVILEGLLSFSADSMPLSIRPGYAYQLQNSSFLQDVDLIFIDADIEQYFSSYFEINYGLYAEYFTIKNRYNSLLSRSEGRVSGWRSGPQAGLKYLKDFIIDFNYRFLLHSSTETKFPSHEHLVRLLAGRIILPRLSAFLLVDYYFRSFRMKDSSGKINTNLYTPINNENNVYVKLGYDLKDHLEMYIKYGYSRENLFNRNLSLNGWSLMLGIQLTNMQL